MLVRNTLRAARPMSVAAALLGIMFATPAAASAAPTSCAVADCSVDDAETDEPSTDVPATDSPVTDAPTVEAPESPASPAEPDDGFEVGSDDDDDSESTVVPAPPETETETDDDDDDHVTGGGIGGIGGGIGGIGGGGTVGSGGSEGGTDTGPGTGDFGESAQVTITNEPDDGPVIRPNRPAPQAPSVNGPRDSTAGVPVAPSLPSTSHDRTTPASSARERPDSVQNDSTPTALPPASASDTASEPVTTIAAPRLTSKDFAAAGTGIAGLILIAGSAGAMTFRNARAARVRVNAARAEFLSPGDR